MGDTPLQYEGHGNWSGDILAESGSHVTSVPDSALTPLAFGALSAGDDLLDLTTPALPVVTEAGNYTVVVNVSVPVQAGKHSILKLELDSGAQDVVFQKTGSIDTAAAFGGVVVQQITGIAEIPQGGAIKVSFEHDTGSAINATLAVAVTRG